MFFSRYKKNNVYPRKPHFYYIKVGFKGSKVYRYVFVMKRVGSSEKKTTTKKQIKKEINAIFDIRLPYKLKKKKKMITKLIFLAAVRNCHCLPSKRTSVLDRIEQTVLTFTTLG